MFSIILFLVVIQLEFSIQQLLSNSSSKDCDNLINDDSYDPEKYVESDSESDAECSDNYAPPSRGSKRNYPFTQWFTRFISLRFA